VKNETIRTLDAVAGSALCALLTLHRRLVESVAGSRAARAPSRRILFLKLIEQGATVLAYDAVRRAGERVGRENVYFCVFEENRPILDAMDLVPAANVFVIRSAPLSLFLSDALRLLRRVRRAEIDSVIDMEFFSRASAALAYLSGARRRVGLHRFNEEAPYRGDLMTHRVLYNPFLHTARAYRLLVDALDLDPDDTPLAKIPIAGAPPAAAPPYVPDPAERRRVQALLDEAAGRTVERPLVLLNPNCRDALPLRRWPADRFAELGRRVLADHREATVVITGAPSERAAAEALCRDIASPRAINLAGRTTLRDVLVLYDLADVLVTNDSGPGHFASLTSIEAVVMFGPGAPSQFGPIGGRSHVLWAGLACSPCANVHNHRLSSCTNNVCMQAISVDEVYARVAAVLAARAEPRAAG
jgi:ADP-heptose:LPS heptosyltransferase